MKTIKKTDKKILIIVFILILIGLLCFCCFMTKMIFLSDTSTKNTSINSNILNILKESEEENLLLKKKIEQAQSVNNSLPEEIDGEKTDLDESKAANLKTIDQNTKNTLYNVLDVVDGDTIKIEILGTLRLIGIDTPETKDPRKPVQCFGVEASSRAKELLSGKKVYLEFDDSQSRIDKYGRTLAYIYREDNYFYNLQMIKDGYAFEYTYNIPYKYQQDFKNAQTEARNDKKGLWAENTCNGVNSPISSVSSQKSTISYSVSSSSKNSSVSNTTTSKRSSSQTTTSNEPITNSCKYNCISPDRDCSDFSSKQDVLNFWTCCGFTKENDPMKLDSVGIGDGIPCESLK